MISPPALIRINTPPILQVLQLGGASAGSLPGEPPNLRLTWEEWEAYLQIITAPPEISPSVRPYSTGLLLVFLLVFIILGHFNQSLGRFYSFAQLVQVGMVTWPVILLVTGFDPHALLLAVMNRVPDSTTLYSLLVPLLGLTNQIPGYAYDSTLTLFLILFSIMSLTSIICFKIYKLVTLSAKRKSLPLHLSYQIQNVYLDNLVPLVYNSHEKNKIFSIISLALTHFDAQAVLLTEVQKVSYVVSQLKVK